MTAALEGVNGQHHAPAVLNPGKDPVPIRQEAGWAPGPVWTGGKSRPTWIRSPDRAALSRWCLFKNGNLYICGEIATKSPDCTSCTRHVYCSGSSAEGTACLHACLSVCLSGSLSSGTGVLLKYIAPSKFG